MENETQKYDRSAETRDNSSFNPAVKQRLPAPEELRAYEAKREENSVWYEMLDEWGAGMKRILRDGPVKED